MDDDSENSSRQNPTRVWRARAGLLMNKLELPMLLLSVAWLGLLIFELVADVPPALGVAANVIWGLFIADVAIRLAIARNRPYFLRRNWVLVLSLILPALRVLRIFHVLRLLRILSRLNRLITRMRLYLAARGAGYVGLATVTVIFAGAAGMYAFEGRAAGTPGFETFADSLWWTAMILTTIGSGHWPQTAEGRILGFMISLYTFGVFGYFTAVLASFFVGQDQRRRS